MDAINVLKSRFGTQTDNGACGRVARIASHICELVSVTPGNIVELGCGVGQTSVFLLEAAEKYGRKFIAVDPWYDSCGYKFAEFSIYVNILSPSIEICRKESNDPQVIALIQSHAQIAFGFVDSDMYSKACVLRDITTFAEVDTAVICVDDQKCDTVNDAIKEFLPGSKYERIGLQAMHECYLVRKA